MTGLSSRERLGFLLVAVTTAIAGFLHFASSEPGTLAFIAATAALCGVAWLVSFATEQLGESFGPAVTGVLQTTLGNLPEFFVVLFALRAHQVTVATTSIVGSILANALLVLGLTIFVGARASSDGVMRFTKRLPNDTATLLFVAVFIIVMTAISAQTSDPASHHAETISIVGAICLLIVYVSWVVPYLRSDGKGDPEHRESPRLPVAVSAVTLALAGVGAAFVSEWFISALEPAMDAMGLSEAFAGLVVVAIAGNAVENTTALVLAAKRNTDLAMSVVKNSVAQIAVFLFPALVLVSLLFATTLTFAMAPIYAAALAFTAIAMWQITSDGEATMFEGLALVATYVILATITLFE
ncbi:MAG: sodium:proton exchanger [Thermoleophilia bacterium]|nr:sodium:proton exchanger [Thermoleophilia bacterium]